MAAYIGGGVVTPTIDSGVPQNTVTETPPPIQQLQPPASNSGSDDPTAGIAKDAGGLSSTAHIGSPVTGETERQTIVSSVLEYAFGKQEREAAVVDAKSPTSATVLPSEKQESNSNNSGTVFGVLAGAGAAAGAAVASIIPGMASTSGAETTAPSSVGATTNTEGEKAVETTAPSSVGATTSEHQPIAFTPFGVTTGTDPVAPSSTGVKTGTEDKTLGEKAAETAESATASASAAGEKVKESVTGEEHSKPKPVSDHEAATRENKEAIPTAGGEKLGAAHAGESKIIPDNPKPADQDTVSSSAGQPDSTTAANTAQNTTGGASKNRAELTAKGDDGPTSRPKFMDRVKQKLHLDKKEKP